MAAKSKKLKTHLSATGLVLGAGGSPCRDSEARHDARIAHEQQEVISRLSAALDAAMASMARLNATDGAHKTTWDEGIAARAAAAPFLED